MQGHEEIRVKQSEVKGYADVIAILRALPDGEFIIKDNFLYEDANFALEQFCKSQEWHDTVVALKPRPGVRVLDYGAGRCIASIAFACLGCNVVAMDINASPEVGLGILQRGQVFNQYAINVQSVVGDGEHIPFEPDAFDIVYCREALHHAFNLKKLASNLVRVLKPGGRFFAYGDHRRPWWSSDEQFRRIHPAVKFGVNEHSYLKSEYRRALSRAGLQNVRIVPILSRPSQRWHHWGMLQVAKLPFLGKTLHHFYDRLRHYRAIGSQIIILGEKKV
jgi:2-polyprenyl-3-methyl-5-hydroxy-6-metoxy-1,4-benzoquinol methylase